MKKNRLAYGVGINDYNGKVSINGRNIKSYRIWQGMLERCYSEKYHERKPTYIGCEVCDEWRYFSKFKEWFDGNYKEIDGIKFQLDKDLFGGESKIYSPETCVFIPSSVNNFLANRYKNNLSGYIGVYWHRRSKKWIAMISCFETSKQKHIGCFDNIEDAAKAYYLARKIEAEKVKEYMRSLNIYNEEVISRIK